MPYIYDGVLTQHVIDSSKSMMQKYPFPVEMRGPFPSHDWMEATLQKYDWWQEDDMSSKMYPRNSILWGCYHEHSGKGSPSFLFLKSEEDHRRVVAAFPDQIVNAKPFRTIIL